VEEVQRMMRSMLGTPVSERAAERIHEATRGIPFYIDETVRGLAKEGVSQIARGEVEAAGEHGWRLEIDKRILSRASQLNASSQDIIKLLAVSARPLALAHLRTASRLAEHALSEELLQLERERFVMPVPSDSAMYALGHDRIRESLFDSLTKAGRVELHHRLGAALLHDFEATQRGDLAVFAAMHLNETALPDDDDERLGRCDLNLDAAQSARYAGDFRQAMVFLEAAGTALGADLWRRHQQSMRLIEQRATTLIAMREFRACIATCDAGISHASDLIEEGRLSVLRMESLTHLRRHHEVLDTYVSFVNRAIPEFRVPRHPGMLAALAAAVRTRRLVRRHGVAHLMRPMDADAHPLATQVVRVSESVVNSAFVVAPHLFVFAVLTLARLAARHGTPRASALTGPVSISTIVGMLRDYQTVAELGRAVANVLDTLPDAFRGRARFFWAAWPANLSVPLAHLVDPFAVAALECSRARDSTQEANTLWAGLVVDFFLAKLPLLEIAEKVRAVLGEWQTSEPPEAAYYTELLGKAIASLHKAGGDDEAASEEGSPPALGPAMSTTTHAASRTFEMASAALLGDADRRGGSGFGWHDLRLLNEGLPGTLPERFGLFFAAIVNFTALRTPLPIWRRVELRLVNRYILRTLRRFAILNPSDFTHRVSFLEAERLRTNRNLQAAEQQYRIAVEQGRDAGFRSEQALVLEKYAEVLRSLGRVDDARARADESISLYREWGALAKVKWLEDATAMRSTQGGLALSG
jgi:hypothetical protein